MFQIKLFIKFLYPKNSFKENILTIFLLQISLTENGIKRKSLLMSKGRMRTPFVMIHLDDDISHELSGSRTELVPSIKRSSRRTWVFLKVWRKLSWKHWRKNGSIFNRCQYIFIISWGWKFSKIGADVNSQLGELMTRCPESSKIKKYVQKIFNSISKVMEKLYNLWKYSPDRMDLNSFITTLSDSVNLIGSVNIELVWARENFLRKDLPKNVYEMCLNSKLFWLVLGVNIKNKMSKEVNQK